MDNAIVLGAFLLFLGIFRLGAGAFPLDRVAALVYLAVCVLSSAFYRLLVVVRTDRSPGLRLLGLRVLHFDGRPPTKRQRLLRVAAGSLSLLPAGIGFFWALMDEEHLTFHDHISETFIAQVETGR